MTTATKHQAPANAFIFTADACKFADPTGDKSGLRRMEVEVIARTGNPVYHWYFDWIVHDFAGMKHKPKVAFDYRHDPDQPIGFADKIVAGDDLKLYGVLLSRSPDDAAAGIMDLGPAGIPYEASIHFDPRSLVLEQLPAGSQTTVNNRLVTGPLTIARQWELLRVAFCLTGVDGGTAATFEHGKKEFPIEWKAGAQKVLPVTFESMFKPSKPPQPQRKGDSRVESDKWEGLFRCGK